MAYWGTELANELQVRKRMPVGIIRAFAYAKMLLLVSNMDLGRRTPREEGFL